LTFLNFYVIFKLDMKRLILIIFLILNFIGFNATGFAQETTVEELKKESLDYHTMSEKEETKLEATLTEPMPILDEDIKLGELILSSSSI